jgi:hypothetical protein
MAIEAKRKWLRGEITDDELDAARAAAWDAARDALLDITRKKLLSLAPVPAERGKQ